MLVLKSKHLGLSDAALSRMSRCSFSRVAGVPVVALVVTIRLTVQVLWPVHMGGHAGAVAYV